METTLEGILTIKKSESGELLAVVFHDQKKRSQIFYSCKEMGVDEIKTLLDNNDTKIHTG